MKTAEEWLRQADIGDGTIAGLNKRDIEAIQLDAEQSGFERGLREAALVCAKKADEFSPVGIARTGLHEAKHEILTLIDKPKDSK